MRNMSFALTTKQMLAGTKDVTRDEALRELGNG